MAIQIEEDALLVLEQLANARDDALAAGDIDQVDELVPNEALAEATELPPSRLNDAVEFLEYNGYVRVLKVMGTAPFTFGDVAITSLGKYELQRSRLESSRESAQEGPQLPRSPVPVGSPYGFTEQDWEFVELERSKATEVRVVFGHQWESDFFDPERLKVNLRRALETAVAAVNSRPGEHQITLKFVPLSAGYGEHLFNEIARQILAADIAVFETSDLNPNVMVEMGVALTWGIRVLPIKVKGRPVPPSDISGQTWAEYVDDGSRFVDPEHDAKLSSMIERVVRKKAAG